MELLFDQTPSKRLIVLITDCRSTDYDLAHAVHWIADREKLIVLYLVLISNQENRLAISRNMATMKAVTSGNRLVVDVKTTESAKWLETLTKLACRDDVILCQEGQTAAFLPENLASPVLTVPGYYESLQYKRKQGFHKFLSLAALLLTIALITWLQASFDTFFDAQVTKTLITITFCIEIGAIWAWYTYNNPAEEK